MKNSRIFKEKKTADGHDCLHPEGVWHLKENLHSVMDFLLNHIIITERSKYDFCKEEEEERVLN